MYVYQIMYHIIYVYQHDSLVSINIILQQNTLSHKKKPIKVF